MKILIPILGFGRAGGYRVLSKFANEWIEKGHTVNFLCPDSSDDPYFPTNAGIIWVDGSGSTSTTRSAVAKPNGRYHLKALYYGLGVIGRQYEIILANQSLTAWPVALASCGEALKFYYIQAYEPEYYLNNKSLKGFLLSIISAVSYHLPLRRVVNAPLYFKYKNLRASEFVPPGIDLNVFHPIADDFHCRDPAHITVGCIGRKEPEKGTIFVLRAFEAASGLDSRLFLRVAYGNLPDAWAHQKCEVIVPKNDKELADFYRSLDILVAPGTVQHGAPHYPVLEAGACGVPVITTGYMGATLETAWLVPNMDSEAISAAMIAIANHSEERGKKRARFLEAVQHYAWPKVASKLIAIMDDQLYKNL